MNFNIKKFVPFSLMCLVFLSAKAQKTDYRNRIEKLYAAINTRLADAKTGLYYETTDTLHRENLHSWLWPLCAYIQATNEMEAIQPGAEYMLRVTKAIDQYYSNQSPVPAYQDYPYKEKISSRFYDDNEWVAIAYLDAYNRNHQQNYLDVSKMIYRFIQSGVDTVAGGGAYWKEGDKKSKNTCSNGPAVLVALQLYKITQHKGYLDTALQIYNWTKAHLQAPDGVFYDNIRLPSLKIAVAEYTYNTGAMLQSAVLLYNLTGDKKYLDEAERVASAGKKRFFVNGRLPGNYWFNAVMLRAYIELYKVDKNKAWLDFYKQDADAIWQTERDANDMLGKKPAKSLIDQAAMIEIYARLQPYYN